LPSHAVKDAWVEDKVRMVWYGKLRRRRFGSQVKDNFCLPS